MASKWQSYYAKASLPWDSRRPASQLVSFFCSCPQRFPMLTDIAQQASSAPIDLPPENAEGQVLHMCELCSPVKPPAGASILEIGCGTGASAVWLAKHGYQVMAIDLIQTALDNAAATAAAAGLPPTNPAFIQHDVFDCSSLGQTFDMVYDCQVYHALIHDHPEACEKLPQLLFDQLKPGGVLFMLTGNANEPEVGPSVLTAEELLGPLLAVGFELVLLKQTRFDSTEYYIDQLKKRPLAWWVVLQRPRSQVLQLQEEQQQRE